jgi:hypothetical protein
MGYLDQYEQGSQVFDKVVKTIACLLLAAIIGYCVYWLFFRNWREERQVDRFLTAIQEQRFEDGYQYWGCSVAEPCRDYLFNEFLDDWGPQSPLGPVKTFQLGRSYTQPNGAIIEVTVNGVRQSNLWVDGVTDVISFFPY